MQNIQIFNNVEFGQVRTITKNNEVWFIATDICKALDLSNPSMAVLKVDDDERSKFNLGRQGSVNIINEYGLYNLVLASRKKEAKLFKRWIIHEVIPSIRKHGIYATSQTIDNMLADPDNAIKVFSTLKKERQQRIALEQENNEQAKIIEDMKPAKQYYDNVLFANNAMNITQIAKQYGISGKKMNEILNQEKIIYKCGAEWVLYAKYAGKGYIKHHTDIIQTKYGEETKQRIKWTEKGRKLIHEIMINLGYKPINII